MSEMTEMLGWLAEVLEMYNMAWTLRRACGCGAGPVPVVLTVTAPPGSVELGVCVVCAHDLTRILRPLRWRGLVRVRWRWQSTIVESPMAAAARRIGDALKRRQEATVARTVFGAGPEPTKGASIAPWCDPKLGHRVAGAPPRHGAASSTLEASLRQAIADAKARGEIQAGGVMRVPGP